MVWFRAARVRWWLASVALVVIVEGCGRRGPVGACARITGTWNGIDAVADGGQDPSALEVAANVVRNERWRITRVTDTGMQRERVSQVNGHVVGEAMYVREDGPSRCVVDLTTASGPRPMVFVPRADGTLEVRANDGWYTQRLRRAH
jgi:hypothetical protein